MVQKNKKYNILFMSDEKRMFNKLSILFENSKYTFELARDPLSTINKIKFKNYDLIIIDYNFDNQLLKLLISKIRIFDAFTYILLVTNSYNMHNALDIVKNYDIQAYYNKDDSFDKLSILVELITNSIYEFMRISSQLNTYDNDYKSPYLSTIQILRNIAEYKDTYTIGHSFRVSKYSLLIGSYIKLSSAERKILKIGSMFHDIGKISTPNNILIKNSHLSDKEYFQVKFHPLIGSHFLSPAIMYSDVLPIIKFHHERYDGTGYPAKLKGDEIPLLVRIVTIADTFDAMTSKRNYRDALSLDVVISEFEKNKGYQFDPKITDIFLNILKNDYNKIKKIQEGKKGLYLKSFLTKKRHSFN